MKTRKKIETEKVNTLLEQRYLNDKFLFEDTKYQLTPIDGEFQKIVAIEDNGDLKKRELNPEELEVLKQENKFSKGKNQQDALNLIQKLIGLQSN